MKLLLVNGSPHKGNTWKLTQRVKEMLAVYDSAIEFQEVHLIELNLPFCTGCSNCFRNGHRFCPHHEIVQPVMDMIERSDGVVFSVSCFQGHLTGVMKNFTDHMAFMLHRPRYFHKKALIVCTTGGISASSTTKALAATLPGWGFNKCYQLPVTALSWNAYEPAGKDLRKAEKAVRRFYLDVKSGRMHPPSIGVLIPFNLFQALCVGNAGEKEYPTEDNHFWPRYLGMQYAPGIPIPIYKRFLGILIYMIGKPLSKTTVITYRK